MAEDPDKAWAQSGRPSARGITYSAWQPPGQTSSVHSHATTTDELRNEGIYRIASPAECVALAEAQGASA